MTHSSQSDLFKKREIKASYNRKKVYNQRAVEKLFSKLKIQKKKLKIQNNFKNKSRKLSGKREQKENAIGN